MLIDSAYIKNLRSRMELLLEMEMLLYYFLITGQWRSQDFGSGRNSFGGRPRGGSGWPSTPDAGEFSKIFKILLKKITKISSFLHIFQRN